MSTSVHVINLPQTDKLSNSGSTKRHSPCVPEPVFPRTNELGQCTTLRSIHEQRLIQYRQRSLVLLAVGCVEEGQGAERAIPGEMLGDDGDHFPGKDQLPEDKHQCCYSQWFREHEYD